MREDYKLLCEQLNALCEGVDQSITILANASALLNESLTRINWVGFYLLKKDMLVLGPFQGKPACTRIQIGKGVCGTAVKQNQTQLVADVHAFPGHIACDSASNSEIVIPLRINQKLIGVLDIDSPEFDRFSQNDKEGLEAFSVILEGALSACEDI